MTPSDISQRLDQLTISLVHLRADILTDQAQTSSLDFPAIIAQLTEARDKARLIAGKYSTGDERWRSVMEIAAMLGDVLVALENR